MSQCDHAAIALVRALVLAVVPECERCGSHDGLEWEDARTAYDPRTSWDQPFDFVAHWLANQPSLLCRECAEEHHAHWDERWAEYYGGLM